MTYWPISSPSVFAATKHTNPERTHVSHDGVKRKQQSQVEDETPTQGKSGVEEKNGTRLQQQSASGQSAEDDIYGKMIAIRVTRSGQMFATLTHSTLTIWQTKARLCFCSMGLLLMVH